MTTIREHLKALMTLGQGAIAGLKDPAGDEDPFDLFREWYATAEECGMFMPEAISLSTVSPEGRPSSRMVLLKNVDDRGFHFFTNYESRKAQEIEANPHVSLILHWAVIERQIRIEGAAERLTEEESFAYYRTRGRGSRIGAWASKQSQPLSERREFDERVKEVEARFKGQDEIPLPPFWGGYRVVPTRIEFWQGRASRLHDRWVFSRLDEETSWGLERLYP